MLLKRGPMPTDPAEELAKSDRAFLIAAAGCGKTETVARAAGTMAEGRQLLLTHTHAGVRALKDRLKKVGADPGRVHIDTIAGFALRYAASFPTLSGIETTKPLQDQDWTTTYDAGRRVLDTRAGRRVLMESYAGLFVDEYQDCTIDQHRLVMTMAESLPCRVVLDPLQGIFGFAGALISVADDLAPTFERLPDLETPFRWMATNPELGEWLMTVRQDILAGRSVDLRGAPIERGDATIPVQLSTCFRLASRAGSVIAVGRWKNDCQAIARNLRGRFTVMEPIECPDLLQWAKNLEAASGPERAAVLIEFASACMTQVGTSLRTARAVLRKGGLPTVRANSANPAAVDAIIAVAKDQTLGSVTGAMALIEGLPGAVLHRRELWRDMARSVREHMADPEPNLAETAWRVRDRGRQGGRRVEIRTVSRTLLVKGLEFDHAVVLNAHAHPAPDLYVALTRASRSLTVLSTSNLLAPPAA